MLSPMTMQSPAERNGRGGGAGGDAGGACTPGDLAGGGGHGGVIRFPGEGPVEWNYTRWADGSAVEDAIYRQEIPRAFTILLHVEGDNTRCNEGQSCHCASLIVAIV
eukprot:2088773-Prymnesium_polylepis.1